jgi:exopolyphosphatase/guanosine-5'-triphosphate,3'-diphosphate pyrophosphatase
MPTFAAVDIGANSVRLKIARLTSPQRRLEAVHEDREVTRLGESVFRTGLLSPQAMAHTIRVLQRFHKSAQSYGADSVRVVGTSALRECRNAPAFIDWVRSATGWRLEVITGLEEGRLIHLALISSLKSPDYRMLLIDLGGGSCELTVSDHGQIRHMFSLPLGAVRLTQEFLHRDPPRKKELERMRGLVAEEVGRVERQIAADGPQVTMATSGSAAALSVLWTSRHGAAGNTVPTTAIVRIAQELARIPEPDRMKLPGIGTRRAEIVIAGATVFAELMQTLRLPAFRYSPLGLREGLIAQMIADYDRGTRFHRQIESQRWNSLLALGKHYGADLKFANRVRALALELFAGLKSIHRLPPEYAEWLSAAAMLQEVGSFINRTGRRRHTYYVISHSEIFGYTVHQRRIIAAIARYVGRSRPSPESRPMRALTVEEHERVPKAVALLRLARALDQGRKGNVKQIRVRVRAEAVNLEMAVGRNGAELELWALEKERRLFRALFGRELIAVSS